MDELKQIWTNHLQQVDFSKEPAELPLIIRSKSINLIEKLKMRSILRMRWCTFITISLLLITPFTPHPVNVLLIILFSVYLLASLLYYQELRFIKKRLTFDHQLLRTLRDFRFRLKISLILEIIGSLILYPITACAGFLMGMYLFDPSTSFLNGSADWFLLMIPMSILAPLFYLWLLKSQKQQYGEILKSLDQRIIELENV